MYFGTRKGNAFLGTPKGVKDPVPRELRSRGRVREHLSSDKSLHIFKHLQDLQSSEPSGKYCSTDSFEILNSAFSKFQLKLKEATYAHQLGKAQFKSTSQSLQFNT